MANPVVFTIPASGVATVAATQSSAAILTLNGTLANGPATMIGVQEVVLAGIERTITLTSAADNLSTNDYKVAGSSISGLTISQTISGPSSNTVETTTKFHIVSAITRAAGSTTGTLTAGTGSSANTNYYKTDMYANPFSLATVAEVTAAATVSVQYTYDDVENTASPILFALISNATTNSSANLAAPVRAVRGIMVSCTGNGAVNFDFIQAG